MDLRKGDILTCKEAYDFPNQTYSKKGMRWIITDILHSNNNGDTVITLESDNTSQYINFLFDEISYLKSYGKYGESSLSYLWDYYETPKERRNRIAKLFV